MIKIRNTKIYKPNFISKIRMFPSDPTGSLDVYFSKCLISYLNVKRRFILWKKH